MSYEKVLQAKSIHVGTKQTARALKQGMLMKLLLR